MTNLDRKNNISLKYLLALITMVATMVFMHTSATQAQWPFWGMNSQWSYNIPSSGYPFFPFGQIPAYSYNNNAYFAYNSFLTPGLPPSSRSYYNNPTNYANPYGQDFFDSFAYQSRSYTSGYSDYQIPPPGVPRSVLESIMLQAPRPPYGWGYYTYPQRPEPEPIDITSDTGKWESQELTDEEGNKLKGEVEYNRSDDTLKMSGSSLPLGEGYLTEFRYTPRNGSAPISFKAVFDSGYTAEFTGTAKNTMASSSISIYKDVFIDPFVVEGNYVVKDSSGQIADRGIFNM